MFRENCRMYTAKPGNRAWILLYLGAILVGLISVVWAAGGQDEFEISAEELSDKLRGGLLGQLLGNLNGLPHEMKYIDQPGAVQSYTPALPDGARTDDDTDIEWVYIVAMQKDRTLLLPPGKIVQLWKSHINQSIWCANEYARSLMDLGIEPPLTGTIALNPWSDFNISGQFLCETFALIAPAMPQTAAKTALHYIHVGIEGEPAQVTQLFASMIAQAYVTDDMQALLDSGLQAVDPHSIIRTIVTDVRDWHSRQPDDWKAVRQKVKDKYSRFNGAMRDRNGYELNTASTVAALLFGKGDFVETLRTAMNFGWDADNNAATSATIVGVIKGYRWMQQQNWDIRDFYKNTTRPGMPTDETITRFGDRLIELADLAILSNGGRKIDNGSAVVYRIQRQSSARIEPLPDAAENLRALQTKLADKIQSDLINPSADATTAARAAYLAICLDLAGPFSQQHAEQWSRAIANLKQQPRILKSLYESSTPAAESLRTKAAAVGLSKN
jgi:hypothetical protein